MTALPIDAVLDDLRAALRAGSNAVLVAPPGAGKTTKVPLALLGEPWMAGAKLIMLAPRRLAARAAAARMASLLGEPVGETVGYRVRLDSKVSARTRIEVVTEGVFTRQLLSNAELPGVAAVLFDEIHERSLDADLGLALALDVQAALRPDLRLLPMSATLDGARVGALLGDAPLFESQGRLFPVETRYDGRDPNAPLERQVGALVRKALAEEDGSILVFLPGMAEINRTARALADNLTRNDVDVRPLYGALDLKDQQAAIAPAPTGRRKVVLATSIAETSLTIDGVRVVIDSGLARRPRYEPGSGLTRLAHPARDQAGRLEPGLCYRLWDAAETRALPAYDPPEILDADLTSLALDLADWGVTDPAALRWLDPPPAAAWSAARSLLMALGALDADGRLTAEGREFAALPLHPRLAHMLHAAARRGQGGLAARIAALLAEPGLGGNDTDLRTRLERFHRDDSARAKASRDLAARWARAVNADPRAGDPSEAGAVLALAYPDRIGKSRGVGKGVLLASGRGVLLDAADPLAREAFLVVADLAGTAEKSRLLLAAPISDAELRAVAGAHIDTQEDVRLEGKSGKVEAFLVERLGAITLSQKPLAAPSQPAITAALLRALAQAGLPWTDSLRHWQARVGYLHALDPNDWPDVSDAALLADLSWLEPYLAGKRRLTDLDAETLGHAMSALLPPGGARRLDSEAPARLATPAGTSHAIDYSAPGGPCVELRVQELFGLTAHPMVAGGRIPLTLVLLSPVYRPIQTTKDLPGFWRGSWAAVKAEMKGRYPKHVWPDDPAAANATTRAKPRGT
jgi:ATP-dependent helicase HrpB